MDRGRLESIQRNRSDTAGSKVKVERLKILLQNLKDGERQSKMRNDSLLKDFEKVNRLADDLDTKARKLKRVKQEYETYINTIYPQWKENIEFHKSPKLKTEEDLDHVRYPSWRANKAEFSHIEDPYSQSQSRMSRINDDRPSLIGSFKQNGRSPYYSQGFLNKSDKDIDNMSQAVPIFNGVKFEAMQEREKSVTNAGIIPHDTYLELNHNTLGGRNKFLDSNFSQRYEACNERTEGVRPVSLNITKLKEGEDISSFTILPQALALSPDGKLVLLPMMFSPEMLPPSNKNEMNIYKRGINENIMETGANTVDEETKNIGSDQSSKSVFNEWKTSVSNAKDKSTARHDIVHDGLYPRKQSIDDSNSQVKVFDKKTHAINEQYSASDGYVKTNSSNIGKNALPVASIGDDKGIDYSDINTEEVISSKNGLAEVNPKVSDKTEINANTVNEIEMTRNDYDEIIEEANQMLITEEKLESSVDDFQDDYNVLPEKNHPLHTNPEGKDNLCVAAATAVKSDLMLSVTEQQVTFESLELGLGQSDENMNKLIEKDFYKESNGRPLDAGNLNRSHEGSSWIDGKVPLDEGQVLSEIDECLNGNDRYEKNADDKTEERENEVQERNDNVIEEGKEKVLDVPEISYLFEEIENRMETIDRKEFYRKPIENAEADVLKRIKKSLLLQDNLNEFDTCDLCIVSRQSLAEFVMLNSKDGCIVKSHVDLSAIYTLDGFREILSSDFEELWEYVFNHMELLAANEIFESAIVCQIFSKLLSPGNESMALMVSQAIQRILDGEDDDVTHEDDEKSFCDEESSREGSQSGIASRGFQVIDGGNGKANEYSFHSSTDLKDPKPLVHAESDKSSKTLETQKETEKKIKSESSEKKEDLSLDLGSISNGESDDDDDSTFDSAKLTPHKTFEEPHEQSHTQDLYDGRDDEDEDTVSNDRSNLSPEDKQEGQNEIANSSIDEDSDEDLEDMLSTSLVLNGSKNDKDLPKYEPTFAVSKKEDNKPPLLFKSNHDSFEVDESLPQRIEENSMKNEILSPGNSKSISSKFRRPGFWENSDSESEIADLNVSGGNNLSDQNDKEDEFDFDFYN